MKKVARRELDNLLHLFKRIVFFLKCGNVKIKVIYYSKYQMLIWIFMMLNLMMQNWHIFSTPPNPFLSIFVHTLILCPIFLLENPLSKHFIM